MLPTKDDAVTLALIAQRMDALTLQVQRLADDHEERLRKLENERLPAVENRIGQLSERLGVWQLVQASFTTISATIAAIIGKQT